MVEEVHRKALGIKDSGRSSDFITPSFGFGCLFNCSYCYMKRHKPEGVTIAQNIDQILIAIHDHLMNQSWPKKPNQTHKKFYTYDISCNEDFSLHLKHHKWKKILNFFVDHPYAFATMATKFVNKKFLEFDPRNSDGESKIRIRMSLMPEEYRKILEPETSSTGYKIDFINKLIEAGYDVDINFSPVVVHPGGVTLYEELFQMVEEGVDEKYKDSIDCEVIFLTHNKNKHEYNLKMGLPGEDLLWKPKYQERKISSYGGENLRYNWRLKKDLIEVFTKLHDQIIPWNTIRYIF